MCMFITGAFLSGPGAMEEAINFISNQSYMLHSRKSLERLKVPRGDSVLVFDEVKVVSRLNVDPEFQESEDNWSSNESR